MPNYMLLLHEQPSDFSAYSAEEMQAVIAEYIAWRQKVEDAGKFVNSEKLKDEGGLHLVHNDGKLRVTDGPYAEAAEVIGGYFTISADSYDDAVATASDCPHLKYGGRIELREVEPTG